MNLFAKKITIYPNILQYGSIADRPVIYLIFLYGTLSLIFLFLQYGKLSPIFLIPQLETRFLILLFYNTVMQNCSFFIIQQKYPLFLIFLILQI